MTFTLDGLPAQERTQQRQLTVRPLAEAYFAWIRENAGRVPRKGKTSEGFSYSLNQEKYLKRFLDDGEIPMDNNLKPYEYFEYLLTKIPQHLDETDRGSAKTCFLGRISYRQDAESEYRRRPLKGGKINRGTRYGTFTFYLSGLFIPSCYNPLTSVKHIKCIYSMFYS